MTECQMIPFPLKARIAKVRRVAEVYVTKTGNVQNAYWRLEVGKLRDRLVELGLPDRLINEQLGEFKQAVQQEINRRYCVGSHNPKGAA